MHTSCKKRVEWLLDFYKNKMTVSADNKIHVLDVGGDNINGSISWTSDFEVDTLDIVETENVDIVVRDPYMWNDAIADDSYDLVVSLNTFQHIEFFWETIREISLVLKPDGIFVLSMPSTRYDGKYPLCCWAATWILGLT